MVTTHSSKNKTNISRNKTRKIGVHLNCCFFIHCKHNISTIHTPHAIWVISILDLYFYKERSLNLPPMKKEATPLFWFVNLSSFGNESPVHGVFLRLINLRSPVDLEKNANFQNTALLYFCYI